MTEGRLKDRVDSILRTMFSEIEKLEENEVQELSNLARRMKSGEDMQAGDVLKLHFLQLWYKYERD